MAEQIETLGDALPKEMARDEVTIEMQSRPAPEDARSDGGITGIAGVDPATSPNGYFEKVEPSGSHPAPPPDHAAVGTDGLAGTGKRTEADTQRLVGLTASPAAGLTASGTVSPSRETITENDRSVVNEFDACRAALKQWMDDAPLLAADGQRIARQAAEFVMGWMTRELDAITRENRELAEKDRKAELFCKEMLIRCGDALSMVAKIDFLRGEPGSADSVEIACADPEPDSKDEQELVVCNGQWNNWQEQRFYGETVLAALGKAEQAKRKAAANP